MGHTGVTTTVSIQWDLIDVRVGVETTDCFPVVDVKVQMYTLTVLYINTQSSSSPPLVHSGPPYHL